MYQNNIYLKWECKVNKRMLGTSDALMTGSRGMEIQSIVEHELTAENNWNIYSADEMNKCKQ